VRGRFCAISNGICDSTMAVPPSQRPSMRNGSPTRPGHDHFERAFRLGQFTRPALAQLAVELRIVGFPEEMAELDDVEIEFAVLKGEPHRAVTQREHFVDRRALFAVGVAARSDDDAVAGLERRPRVLTSM